MKKTFLVLVLAFALIFSAVPALAASTATADTDGVTLEADTVTAFAGESVDVNIVLSGNAGINALEFDVLYDDELLALEQVTQVATEFSGMGAIASPYAWNGTFSDSTSNTDYNGTLFTMTFKVNETAQTGDSSTIEFEIKECFSADLEDVAVTVTEGAVSVAGVQAPSDDAVSVPSLNGGDVTAVFESADPAAVVYNVVITWGALDYTYIQGEAGVWDPEQHEYVGVTESAWSVAEGADTITVTNHSNAAVDAELAYNADGSFSEVTGSFDKTTMNLATAEGTTYAEAPSDAAKLTLEGELDASVVQETVIGSVTVKLTAVE